MSNDNEHQRFWTWIGLLFVVMVLYCFYCNSQHRDLAKEAFKRKNIVLVKGTVMHADCNFDPTSGKVECRELVVMYPNENNTLTNTKSFQYESTIQKIDKVPQIGMTVLVSWNRKEPENAYVMAIQ